jgi:hypothetical protein
MRLVGQSEKAEEHFTEGEPDLEAPEELALGELDEDTLLEEDLDNDDLAEEDVEEDVLELTLEDLVHSEDGETDATADIVESTALDEIGILPRSSDLASVGDGVPGLTDAEDLEEEQDDLEVADLEDLDESLDRILAERLAGDAPSTDAQDEDELQIAVPPLTPAPAQQEQPKKPGYRKGEFVCRSCFLVRSHAQLADPSGQVCRDCSG